MIVAARDAIWGSTPNPAKSLDRAAVLLIDRSAFANYKSNAEVDEAGANLRKRIPRTLGARDPIVACDAKALESVATATKIAQPFYITPVASSEN